MTDGQFNLALDRASSVVDSYLRKRHTLPLTSYGGDIKEAVCALAAQRLMTFRGYSPMAKSDEAIRLAANDARAWLKDVARGFVEIEGEDTTPDLDEAGPIVEPAGEQSRARLWTRTRC